MRLKHQHEAVSEIIEPVSKEHIRLNPKPGKWSIHDNITHLAKYQPLFVERINKILHHDKPVFERYTAENDPEFETWRQWETNELLKRLSADRKIVLNLITHLSNEELDRVGIHGKFGKLNIPGWTEFFLLHEAHHIYTIFQLAHETEV